MGNKEICIKHLSFAAGGGISTKYKKLLFAVDKIKILCYNLSVSELCGSGNVL